MCFVETKASSSAGLEFIEVIDQLPQPACALAVGGKDQTRQVSETRFGEFFRKGRAQLSGPLG